MYYPQEEEFKKLSKKGNLIPVYREILADLETPVSAFKKLDEGEFSYLLESVERGERLGRYSFLGGGSGMIFKSKGKKIHIIEKGKDIALTCEKDPLHNLKEIIGRFKVVNLLGLPRFSGGAVGYLGYEMIRFWEKIPALNNDDLGFPDSLWMLSDTLLIFDHIDHKIKIVSHAFLNEKEPSYLTYEKTKQRIDEVIARLKNPLPRDSSTNVEHTQRKEKTDIQSNLTPELFMEGVKKAKKYIKRGDAVQVVLSQRLKRKINVPLFNIYRCLRSLNPSPYMYYLKCGDFQIIGSSPEILVIDNYDSFVYNLVQYLGELGKRTEVYRNDNLSLKAIERKKPEGILISPGPGRPEEAGMSNPIIEYFAPRIPTRKGHPGRHVRNRGR